MSACVYDWFMVWFRVISIVYCLVLLSSNSGWCCCYHYYEAKPVGFHGRPVWTVHLFNLRGLCLKYFKYPTQINKLDYELFRKYATLFSHFLTTVTRCDVW